MSNWSGYPYAHVQQAPASRAEEPRYCCGQTDQEMLAFVLAAVIFSILTVAIVVALYVDQLTRDIDRLEDKWEATALGVTQMQSSFAASLSALNATLFART